MLWRLSWLRAVPRFGRPPRSLRHFNDIGPSQTRNVWTKTTPLVTHAQLLKAAGPGTQVSEGSSENERTEEVKVAGLVRSARWKKSMVFVHLHDGTTYEPLQAILPIEIASGIISNGAYVELVGKWQASPAQGQSHELQVSSVANVGGSDAEENPIQKTSMTPQYLRTIPHLRTRTPFQSLLARGRSQLISSVATHFNSRPRPVIQVHPPLITSSDCEGAGEVFTLAQPGKSTKDGEEHFFKEPKYLTVSSQLHLEAWSADLGDVWALSPTFRAEQSDTGRHLAEFYMLEGEFRSTNRLEAIMAEAESLIRSMAGSFSGSHLGQEMLAFYADRKHRGTELESVDLKDRWSRIQSTTSTWDQITYTDAMIELERAHKSNKGLFEHKPEWDQGLALEHERWIVDNISSGGPVFVTHYPRDLKPFYMLPSDASDVHSVRHRTAQSEDLRSTVSCFDLLFPNGYAEVSGGSLREHRLDHLIVSMREKGLLKMASVPRESQYPYLQPGEGLGNLQWYADLRRFGSSPHGGFGIGFDRLLGYLTGISNVRDVAGFPRYWGSCHC